MSETRQAADTTALDPQAKALLDQIAASSLPRIWTMTPAQARDMYEQSTLMLGAKDVPIGKVEDLAVPTPDGTLPVRMYTPIAAPGGSRPALVYFHGGGFVIGSRDTHDAPCRILANEARCVVLSVEYRLSPEHRFPACFDDALALVRWVFRSAPDLGIDPTRIAVGGDSAGGTIAAVVAQEWRSESGPPLALQLLVYPKVSEQETESRRRFAEGFGLDQRTIDYFRELHFADPADQSLPRSAPLDVASLSGVAPAAILVAGFDPLRDEGRAYHEKLKAAGIQSTLIEYPGQIHGFITMGGVIDQAGAALAECADALRVAFA
ncbi:alpha/beta hydrolase [Zavarzinia sp. CC-PAN008]|uniref:alpha/beta hydrolase n=1 Tax=Zavarzinia sp. CC-PAN008 TaxID=3243332 RepID=UPI003F746E9A